MNHTMKTIGERIATQDNRCTSDPIFIVQQRRRFWGVDKDYTDDIAWVDTSDGDCPVADEKESAWLDRLESDGKPIPDGWVQLGYLDQWEFVTACFTEKGCEDYIAANGHNLTDPRIYAASGYRNREFIAVRNYLLSLTEGATQ